MSGWRFVSLFAGCGGFDLAAHSLGGECVSAVESDPYACALYADTLPDKHLLCMDVRDLGALPPHDVMLAGFPCQPFSIAGKGRGLADARGGSVIAAMVRLIGQSRPRAVVLENVPRMLTLDGGRAWAHVVHALIAHGYSVRWAVVGAQAFAPTTRRRLYAVATRLDACDRAANMLGFPVEPGVLRLGDVLCADPDPRYTVGERTWAALRAHRAKHAARGNGFGFRVFGARDLAPTISARYGKDGSECLIEQRDPDCAADYTRPRRLTPGEVAGVMGFPAWYRLGAVSDTRAYRALGNAVVPPCAAAVIARALSAIGVRADTSRRPESLAPIDLGKNVTRAAEKRGARKNLAGSPAGRVD